jgi:hypothetical protein
LARLSDRDHDLSRKIRVDITVQLKLVWAENDSRRLYDGHAGRLPPACVLVHVLGCHGESAWNPLASNAQNSAIHIWARLLLKHLSATNFYTVDIPFDTLAIRRKNTQSTIHPYDPYRRPRRSRRRDRGSLFTMIAKALHRPLEIT